MHVPYQESTLTIGEDGYQYWILNGLFHREDGPAVIWSDGTQSWWLNGKLYTDKKKYQKAAKISDEDMTMLLLRYNWK